MNNTQLSEEAIREKILKLKQMNAKLGAMLAEEKISAEDYQSKKQEITKRFKQLNQLKQQYQQQTTSQSHTKPAVKRSPDVSTSWDTTSPYATPKATLESNNQEHEEYELWNPNAAANWCLLFSPIFGAWLQAINWEELGEPEKAKASRLWIYLTPIVTIIGLIFDINVGLIVLITWYVAEGRKQANYLKDNDIDYIKKPWAKVLGIATVGLFVFIGILMMILVALGH